MQLRTVKNKKTSDKQSIVHCTNSLPMENSCHNDMIDKEEIASSNENLNIENRNEQSHHKLRNLSKNYQGKYQKMNSGKDLYMMISLKKKAQISRKKQLRFLPIELVNIFKIFLTQLNKKNEESLLNRKKKRDETKDNHTISNGNDQQNKSWPSQILEVNQPHMIKAPYGFYYKPNVINVKTNGQNRQQLPYRANENVLLMQKEMRQPFSFDETKSRNESIFNLINDKENLSRMNKLANDGVNHIVAAFYIKSVQQRKARQTMENLSNSGITLNRRSSVPISSVIIHDPKTKREKETEARENPQKLMIHEKMNINNIFNDKFSSNISEYTANQLSFVNDFVKKIKDNKRNEIADKEKLSQEWSMKK